MKTTAHVVPHSHWDREWYLPFEQHRARLVALLDSVLELLQRDDYTSYHLDGQMIALEDYLEIRPQKRELAKRLVREGRLKIGPWYILQDTYLTGSEANVRNLLVGMRMAGEYGGACRIGYLPDAFGNAGQMPQLFAQAGMKAAVFGRGVHLTGRDGVSAPEKLCPRLSEFLWESPDGSRIPSVYFANWYNNGMEIPTKPEAAKIWWDQHLADAERYAATSHLLLMNGCDHQPVQRDLPEALETARKLYPDCAFLQSSLEDYADAVLSSLEAPLEVIRGELEGQRTDGHGTLRNTASARWRIKALNRKNEVLLEKRAEPMAAMAGMAGALCDGDLFNHAWKLLMQNHPHDSICGCSIDEVHREMESRYHRSIQLGEWLKAQAQDALAKRIAAKLPAPGQTGATLVVWNPGAWERTGVVEVVAGVDRIYGTQDALAELRKHPKKAYRLLRSDGAEIPCRVEDLCEQFGFELPDDRFRQPYFERRVRVTFEARSVPAFGYDTYLLEEGSASGDKTSLVTGERRMENALLRAEILEDGTVDLLDKRTGRTYTGLGVFEDVGDVGDEYVFTKALGDAITTRGVPAEIRLVEDDPFRAAFCVEHAMKIPACAGEALQKAVCAMEPRETRQIGRSVELVEIRIRATYALSADSRQIDVRVETENVAKDHRLRMLFPTDIAGDKHYTDAVFDVINRPDVPGENWINPSRCDRMQLFAAVADERGGLAVSNRGQYEYEILDDRRTLAVTLLRAVGELGDWGVFPTPEAQCPGPFEAELALIPLQGEDGVAEGYRLAHEFQAQLEVSAVRTANGKLPARHSFLQWEGDGLICTCLKNAADGKGFVMRLFNVKNEPTMLNMPIAHAVRRSDILETCGPMIAPDAEGVVRLPVRPKEIITVRLEV